MQIKNRQQLLAVLAMGVLALLAADKLLLSPLSRLWQDRSRRIHDLRDRIANGSSLLKRERGLSATWERMRTNTLPTNASLAEQQVREAFTRWSEDSRISITSRTPQWKHDSDEFMTVEYRVEAAGNLAAISKFLYDIERDAMALRLETVEISSRDNDGQQLALGLQISGLVLTPQARQQ